MNASASDATSLPARTAEILGPEYYRRADEQDDGRFYDSPRLVAHIDETAITATTALYREVLPPHPDVLDLMSSYYSHLPEPRRQYSRHVWALGMNADEMARNTQLDEYVVQNLNANPVLPYADAAFDAVFCAVSVQYLQKPVAVFAEVARVLRPGGVFAVTFSNRCFPSKAVAVWVHSSDEQHLELVRAYIEAAGGFERITLAQRNRSRGNPLYAVTAYKVSGDDTGAT